MNNSAAHQKLVNEILLKVGSRPDVRLWTRVVGVGRALKTAQVIAYGVPGETDIDGILLGGRRIGIEVKTGRGQLSEKQIRWRDMLIKFGALYVEARSVDDVLTAIEAAL